jgi:hypothetical protein
MLISRLYELEADPPVAAGPGAPNYRVEPARPPTSSLSPTSPPKILRSPPCPKARTQLEAGDTRRRDGAGGDGDAGAGAEPARAEPDRRPCRLTPTAEPPPGPRPRCRDGAGAGPAGPAEPAMVPAQGSRAGDRDHAATRFRAARTPGAPSTRALTQMAFPARRLRY